MHGQQRAPCPLMLKVLVLYLIYLTTLPIPNVMILTMIFALDFIFACVFSFHHVFAAGSVIRMFLHALGEETFKKGLKYYLTAQ